MVHEFILPEPLLPLSLATRDAAQSSMHLVVRSPDGGVFVTFPVGGERRTGEAIRVERALEDRNENGLSDFRVEVAIDPSAAHRLVIGGLPDSRLVLLLSLLALAMGLAGAAIVQIGRERALAQLREDFVTRVSHELRTPVARIRMFTETLLLDRFRTDDERRRSLEAIDRGSRRLAYLIDNVMQFASRRQAAGASATAIATEDGPIDLCSLAREVIDDFDAMTDTQSRPRIDLHCETIVGATATEAKANARIDRESFHQILINLLDNATKYAGPGSPDSLGNSPNAASPGSPGGACIRVEIDGPQLRVIDRGPGIPTHDRVRVWLPYVRLDRDRQSSIAGAGIGLAVVRDLVTRAGGNCRIEDTPNGGATIVVTFAATASNERNP